MLNACARDGGKDIGMGGERAGFLHLFFSIDFASDILASGGGGVHKVEREEGLFIDKGIARRVGVWYIRWKFWVSFSFMEVWEFSLSWWRFESLWYDVVGGKLFKSLFGLWFGFYFGMFIGVL